MVPGRRATAARDILDRIGVLRSEEHVLAGAIDLAGLSDAALAEIDRLTKK